MVNGTSSDDAQGAEREPRNSRDLYRMICLPAVAAATDAATHTNASSAEIQWLATHRALHRLLESGCCDLLLESELAAYRLGVAESLACAATIRGIICK